MNHNTDPYSTSLQVNLLANKIAEVVEQHVYDRTSELRQIENALLSLPFIQRELKKMLDLKNVNNYPSQTSGSENGDSENGDSEIKAVSMKVRTLESSDVENFSLESNSENNFTEISKLPENDLDQDNDNYDYVNDKVDNIIFTINNLQSEDNLDEDKCEDQGNEITDKNYIEDDKVDEDQLEEESEGEIDGQEEEDEEEDEEQEDEEEEEVEKGEDEEDLEDNVEKEDDEVVKEEDEEEDDEGHEEEDEEEELIEVTIKGNTYFVDSLDNGIIYKIDLQGGEEVFMDVGKVKSGKFILNLNNEIF